MGETSDLYGPIARYYDWDPEAGGFEEDLTLYESLAAEAGGPVLELACGSGRIALHLARLGHDVTGLDISAAMLAQARAKTTPDLKVEWRQADMASFDLDRRFSLIFCAITSFAHLTETEQQASCLDACRRHLQPGGRLVLDLRFPDPAYYEEISSHVLFRWRQQLPSGEWLSKFTTEKLLLSEQRREISVFYDLETASGVQRAVTQYELRDMFPYEADLLLHGAGFEVEAMYGDYEFGPFEDASDRLIYVASPRDDR
jgi:SAM-dependent methyltransferase